MQEIIQGENKSDSQFLEGAFTFLEIKQVACWASNIRFQNPVNSEPQLHMMLLWPEIILFLVTS